MLRPDTARGPDVPHPDLDSQHLEDRVRVSPLCVSRVYWCSPNTLLVADRSSGSDTTKPHDPEQVTSSLSLNLFNSTVGMTAP